MSSLTTNIMILGLLIAIGLAIYDCLFRKTLDKHEKHAKVVFDSIREQVNELRNK